MEFVKQSIALPIINVSARCGDNDEPRHSKLLPSNCGKTNVLFTGESQWLAI